MALRVVFWGNSHSVFSSRHFGALLGVRCELAAVVDVPASRRVSTNPLPAGLPNFTDVARQEDIPVFSPEDPTADEFVTKVHRLGPDLFIAVGYAMILKPAVLAVPRELAANFHASLLPHYRGKHPVFWTLRGGEHRAGLTVHVMDPGIDTGDIIYQVAVRTRKDDTVSSLYSRIMDRSVNLVERLVADVEKSAVPRRPQSTNEGSYFSSTSEEDFRIEWSWEAEKIRRYIQMTPGRCFTTTLEKRVRLSRAEVARDGRTGPAGTLQAIGRTRVLIAVGDGAVWIGGARINDGVEQTMAASCRQLGLKVGAVLG
jgi:methionyl-tRNA formyltransferase